MKNSTSYASAIVLGLASLSLVAVTAACGDDDVGTSTSSSSSGTSGTSGGTSGATSGGTSGTSGTSGDGGTSGGTSGTSGGGAAKAACDYDKKCTPNTFAAEFKDDAACVTAQGTATGAELEGTDPKCGVGTVCGEFTAECAKGTLADAKKCITGGQCTTGYCKGFTGTACGACAAAKAKDAACGATDFTCAGGQRCDFAATKCVDAAKVGDSCDGAAAGNCDLFGGNVCNSSTKKCAKPGQIGDECAAASDCRSGLSCDAKKCADVAPKFLDADATCDPTKYATERCRTGMACDATAKKCQKPTAGTGGLDCKN